MTKITTRVGRNFLLRLRRQTRRSLFVTELLAICGVCVGYSKSVADLQSTEKRVLQQSTGQKETNAMDDPLKQYVNANNFEEIVKMKPVWIADLKRRYAGTIDTSVAGPDSAVHSARFSKLMREWNPVNWKVEDLKSIAGKPTKEFELNETTRRYAIAYIFDDGQKSKTWRFTILWKAEIIVGIEYQSDQQPIKEKTQELQPAHKEISTTEELRKRYINANSHTELATARKAWIADLKGRYGGTIDSSVSGPDSAVHSARFSKLMREWNPLGSTVDDLKSIAGKPSRETKMMDEDSKEHTIIEYGFDDGLNYKQLTYTVSDGVIHKVEYEGH